VKDTGDIVKRIQRWYPILISIGAGAMSLAIGRFCFPYFAFDPDTAAYLFQAKLFAQGTLAAPAPPDFGFSPSPHINIYHGLWFSKYPFGNSLFLVPGVLLGIPWLMPTIATVLTLLLFFSIVKDLFDRRVASVAILLAAASPTTLLLGSSLLSQPTSRLCMATFLWSLLRGLKETSAKLAAVYGAMAGLALGYGFNTRPLVALVFGIASTLLLVHAVVQSRELARFAPLISTSVVAVLLMIGISFVFNAYYTGDPLLMPYHALQAADRMGFGLRGEGYATSVADFGVDFTPAIAFARIWQHTLPAVLFNTVGWGTYVPNMLFFADPAHRFPARAWLLLIPASLIVLALVHRSRRFADLLCASIFLLTLTALFFQYSDHATWGPTPLNTSYYNEAILFGLIPLMARGMLIIYDAATALNRHLGVLVVASFLVLVVSTTNNTLILARMFRNWDPHYQRLPRFVDEAKLHNAVVFVPHSRNAPVGDYPFVPLPDADVVYFRTGPLPRWGLRTSSLQDAYQKYFTGRAAYVFDKGSLRRFEAER
jgi:hypothetical protein